MDLQKLTGVKNFKFIGGKISQENLEKFVDSDLLNSLQHLDLSQNVIYDDRMTPFLEGFHSKNLHQLNLRKCGLSYDS